MTGYLELLELRGIPEDARRGYAFEQTIREILPWSYKPPVAITAKSEQMDAFFEWNGQCYLVEAKAKKGIIKAGSHDWEDFALKLEKRGGQCIGIFCSLFDIDGGVYREARDLAVRHRHAVIIAGDTWDDLAKERIDLTDFLRFMVMQLRAKMDPVPPKARIIREWRLDRETARKTIDGWCQSRSLTFLRRHRLPRHKDVYIEREIDDQVRLHARALRPTQLARRQKTITHGDLSVEGDRQRPTQVIVVRDLSGAGKTTLAVQVALERADYFGASRAALEDDIDDLDDHLQSLGDDKGLEPLRVLDRPLVYVIDSLDEASTHPQKRKEVRGLFNGLDRLNAIAEENELLSFPVLIIFTVREDYWREWESQFEGRKVVKFIKRFPYFSFDETVKAIEKYSTAYEYRIEGVLDERSLEVLSHPFNLQIFSEVNEYVGIVESSTIFDHKLMNMYFSRKKEDVLKRPTVPLPGDTLLSFCSEVAWRMLNDGHNEISRADVAWLAQRHIGAAPAQCEGFVGLLASEQMLVPIDDDPARLRFRHMRFVEYLVAHKVVASLDRDRASNAIQEVGELVSATAFMSLYYVHDFIKRIATGQFPAIADHIAKTYASSASYMQRVLSARRSDLALGGQTSVEDLSAIRTSMQSGDPSVCWDAYFVLAARGNFQKDDDLRSAFQIAWDCNRERTDRWKLITKLSDRHLLLHAEVIKRVVQCRQPKTWEVYLEELDKSRELAEFPAVWREVRGPDAIRTMAAESDGDWSQVIYLLGFAAEGTRFPR